MVARKRQVRKKGLITLDMFLCSQKKSSGKTQSKKEKNVIRSSTSHIQTKVNLDGPRETITPENKSSIKEEQKEGTEKRESVSKMNDASKSPLDILDELFSNFTKPSNNKKKTSNPLEEKSKENRFKPKAEEKKATSVAEKEKTRVVTGIKKNEEIKQSIIRSNIIPTGRVLDEILNKGLTDEFLKCDNSGKCTDGRRLGEIYVDKYGFKRQRGFVRTTRTPVYVDWIVEEATISKLLPKAYKLVTSRGAVAIIPDDFLCELQERYGVIIKNDEVNCKSSKL